MMISKIVKRRILIFLLLFLSVWLIYQYVESMVPQSFTDKDNVSKVGDSKKVTVTVFYECLCPDSKSFIRNHLLPSYEKAPHLLKLDLIPYGKAETKRVGRGSYEFDCQHGPAECLGNKVHACVIARVEDETTRVRLVSCLMDDTGNIDSVGAECAKKFDVAWAPIVECARGQEGSNLLKDHGESTAALHPRISFVPTVLLNQNRDGQPAILKNLWKEICRNLPADVQECP